MTLDLRLSIFLFSSNTTVDLSSLWLFSYDFWNDKSNFKWYAMEKSRVQNQTKKSIEIINLLKLEWS